MSGANSLSGVVARELSGLMGTEEVPHDQDTVATGAEADEIPGSVRGMAREAADAGGGGWGCASARSGATWTATRTRGWTGWRTRAWAKSRHDAPRSMRWCATEALYRERYDGWNVAHFYSFYRRRHGGERSYTWVKTTLQRAGLVAKAPGRGKPPPAPRACAACGDDAAPGRLDPRVGAGCALGPHHHARRCDIGALLDVLRRRGGHRIELSGHGRGHRTVGAAVEPVHRPRLALLDHARGRRQGRPGPSDAVRACDAPARRGR